LQIHLALKKVQKNKLKAKIKAKKTKKAAKIKIRKRIKEIVDLDSEEVKLIKVN
jgi:hypothetical protein